MKTEQPTQGLKSMYLELENFKNIDKKIIEVGGRSMIFLGKNGTGKSTLIQAMKSPMDSKLIPSEPIKQGEERARITHRIAGTIDGEYKEYTMDLYFTPGNKSGRLTITNEKGETMKSPATMIKNIIGNVSFNITGWMNDKKDKKLETLKKLTGCGKEIDLCNMAIKDMKVQRKFKNDRADELEGALKNHGFTQDEINKYSTPIPMEALNTEMATIAEAQSGWDAINNQINSFHEAIPVSQANVTKAEAEMKRLQALMEEQESILKAERANITRLQGNCLEGEKWKAANIRPSVIEVSEKIRVATEHNNHNLRIGALAGQQQEMIKLKGEVDKYKMDIEKKENERNGLIAKSQLPVEGLSFDDENIYFNGIPLEEGQQNTALLFDIGVEVAMSLNPNLKIIFLDDASLFDKQHLKTIVDKIESRGYMAICEMVAETDEVEAIFTENSL